MLCVSRKFMIAYLNGTIINKGKGFAIIRVSDVGYKVFLNPTMLAEIVVGQELELYTHQYVREDSLDLFGFSSVSELELFELLISVSGVGPKSALGVLSVAGPEDIKNSIMRGDSHLLTKVSGIGKKTAERIVLELREKVGNLESGIGNKEIGRFDQRLRGRDRRLDCSRVRTDGIARGIALCRSEIFK